MVPPPGWSFVQYWDKAVGSAGLLIGSSFAPITPMSRLRPSVSSWGYSPTTGPESTRNGFETPETMEPSLVRVHALEGRGVNKQPLDRFSTAEQLVPPKKISHARDYPLSILSRIHRPIGRPEEKCINRVRGGLTELLASVQSASTLTRSQPQSLVRLRLG